jgi:hypothetical protein
MVMGILILSNAFNSSLFFRNNDLIKYSFGSVLIIYGAFRGVNSYFKIKRKPFDDSLQDRPTNRR